jgi:hypothetical protein
MTLIISKGLTLDNGTRAAAIAGVSPTLDYRFAREKREIETVSLTDKLTYTGGNGTFVGSDGFIQRATTNVPRFDHDPLSRQSLGLLSEVERTNLVTFSEEVNNTAWASISNVSITANALASPSNTLTADLLVENTATSEHGLSGPNISYTSGTTYTYSIFAKTFSGRGLRILLPEAAYGQNKVVWFNLAAGTIASTLGTGVTATVTPYSNDWYRLSVSAAATVTFSTISAQLRLISTGTITNYTGDGTSGLFLWGAQLEAASSASTYIPTTSAAVTRTADSAVIDGTGVITGTYTMVEKPAGCAVVSGTNINLQPGFTAERVMVFPAALDAGQITAIRGAM